MLALSIRDEDKPMARTNRPARPTGRLSTLFTWLKRGALALLAIAVITASAGAIVQFTASRTYLDQNPPPGQLLDIGTHSLHLHCVGTGEPVVIFDAGGGESSVTWAGILPPIGKETRACAYDRAGYGWSEPGPKPRDAKQIVTELAALLDAADITEPVVIVGHSLGGAFARFFAVTHPRRVAGLVLVDGSHEDQASMTPDMPWFVDLISGAAPTLARLGVLRLFDCIRRPGSDTDAQHHRCEQVALTRQVVAAHSEIESLAMSFDEIRAAGSSLGDVPLVVLARSRFEVPPMFALDEDELLRQWHEFQRDISGRSMHGQLRIIPDSDHFIHLEQPEATVEAIRNVIEHARQRSLAYE